MSRSRWIALVISIGAFWLGHVIDDAGGRTGESRRHGPAACH